MPNSPPSHPHSPGNRQADPQQTEASPAPASPFTEAYAKLQALLVPRENIAIAPPRPLLSTLAVPAPGLSQNILTTRSQLRAFFLDEVRLVRENNPNGTLEQLWEEFVADVNSTGILTAPEAIRASWHFAFGQSARAYFEFVCSLDMASLLDRIARETDQ